MNRFTLLLSCAGAVLLTTGIYLKSPANRAKISMQMQAQQAQGFAQVEENQAKALAAVSATRTNCFQVIGVFRAGDVFEPHPNACIVGGGYTGVTDSQGRVVNVSRQVDGGSK